MYVSGGGFAITQAKPKIQLKEQRHYIFGPKLYIWSLSRPPLLASLQSYSKVSGTIIHNNPIQVPNALNFHVKIDSLQQKGISNSGLADPEVLVIRMFTYIQFHTVTQYGIALLNFTTKYVIMMNILIYVLYFFVRFFSNLQFFCNTL